MLNYRLISINLDIIVSATIWYVFIRIHVESFNVVYEPSVSICRMGESGLAIRLGHAQCLVITEDREQGFSKTGPIF